MENGILPERPRWIFQARLDSYSLFYELIEGKIVCWESVAHRNTPSRLGEDQFVILFQQGKLSYFGFGKIVGVSSCIAHKPAEHRRIYCPHNPERGADVKYLFRFPLAIAVPPTFQKLRWDSNSLPLLLKKGFRGTVHSVSENDWRNLVAINPELGIQFSKMKTMITDQDERVNSTNSEGLVENHRQAVSQADTPTTLDSSPD